MAKERKMEESVTRDLLSIKTSEAVCRYITSRALGPGARLPAERQLAQMLNVGRNTLRGALNILEKEGIVERKKGAGTFVGTGSVPDNLDVKLLRVNYRDLLEIKIWLEQLAIRRAVKHAAPQQLAALRQAAHALEAAAAQGVYDIAADRAFHQRLLDCGGSDTLAQLVLSLIDAMNGYGEMLPQADAIWLKTVPYHGQIAQALADGTLDFALAAIQYIYQFDLQVLEGLRTG